MEARTAGPSQWPRARIGGMIAVVLLVIAAILAVGEMRYQTCIQKADEKFPAVPVSAFNGRATGPVKVSFVKERAAAVDGCGRM